MADDMKDLNKLINRIRREPTPGVDGLQPYRFGDVTRMAVRWLGPHARAVRGKFDWLKFGKALVLAFLAGQTVNFAVVTAALADAARDPQWTSALPAIATAIVYIVEQGRRLFQDGKDAQTLPPRSDTREQSEEGHA
jgi:hypothetical protein